LAKQGIPVLSHPPYSKLALADFFISYIKNCNEMDEIRGGFIDPADCDKRTEGNMKGSIFSGIQFIE
jgi:hypothetical protein